MKLLLMNAYAAIHEARLARHLTTAWEIATWREEEPPEKLAAALAEADAVVVTRWLPGTPPAPRVRLIQSPAAGYDRMDPAALPPGAVVCNVGEHEIGIAEYVMAAMLDWTIGLRRIDGNFRAGSWADGLSVLGPVHGEIWGRTLGIIGLGAIGKAVAARARPFGMHIIAATRRKRPARRAVDEILSLGALDDMLPRCDFILVALPLAAETRGLIGARQLARCKPSAVLINVARAEIVEEEALYQALKNRVIGGAVLDVWYRYPTAADQSVRPSRFPFHELPNLVMTPHCSTWTEGLFERRWRFIAANLDRFARGQRLRNVVIRPGARAPGSTA